MTVRTRATIAALATVLLWASAFPAIRLGLRSFEPIPLASLRYAVAAAVMLAIIGRRELRIPQLRHALPLALCALLGIAAYNVALNAGQRTVTAGAASFIVNTVPVITALLASVFLGERLRLWGWIGTTISFAGVTLIILGQPAGLSFGTGAILVLGAAICQAVFFTLQRPLVAWYRPRGCAAMVIGLGAAWLSPWLPEGIHEAVRAPATGIITVAYLGVFPAALGYVTWNVAQAHFGASRAANFLYLVPPVATGLALVVAGELPSLATLAGGSLAIGGVVIVNTLGRS